MTEFAARMTAADRHRHADREIGWAPPDRSRAPRSRDPRGSRRRCGRSSCHRAARTSPFPSANASPLRTDDQQAAAAIGHPTEGLCVAGGPRALRARLGRDRVVELVLARRRRVELRERAAEVDEVAVRQRGRHRPAQTPGGSRGDIGAQRRGAERRSDHRRQQPRPPYESSLHPCSTAAVGTTRVNCPRCSSSRPLPPRPVTSYFAVLTVCSAPRDVSTVSRSRSPFEATKPSTRSSSPTA